MIQGGDVIVIVTFLEINWLGWLFSNHSPLKEIDPTMNNVINYGAYDCVNGVKFEKK